MRPKFRDLLVVMIVGCGVMAALGRSAGDARPGFYSQATIAPTVQPTVGDTLTAGDGGLACDPACVAAGPDPSKAGLMYQWIRCGTPHGGGKQAPPGGLPDEGGPCPEPRLVMGPYRERTFVIPPGWQQWHVQADVIAVNYDCGHPRSDGTQECRYSRGESWSQTVGPVRPLMFDPPTLPPPPPPSEQTLVAGARMAARALVLHLRAEGFTWAAVKAHPFGHAYYVDYGGL